MAIKVNITKIAAQLQTVGVAYQVYSLFRYGFLLLAALAVPVLGDNDDDPARYEFLWLLGTTVSFFWISAWLDAYVVSARAAGKGGFGQYAGTAFGMTQLMGLVSVGVLVGVQQVFFRDTVGLELVLWYAGFMYFELGSQPLAFTLLLREKGGRLGLFGLLGYGSYAAVVGVGMALGWGLEDVFKGAAALGAIKWVWAWVEIKPRLEGGMGTVVREMMWQALPVGLVVLVSQGGLVLDGYLVEHYFPTQFAQYRYGSKEFPLVLLMANATSLVYAGAFAGAIPEGKAWEVLHKLRAATERMLWVAGLTTLVLLVSSGWIFDRVLGPDYRAAVPVFDVCLFLSLPRAVFPQSVVRGYRHGFALTLSAVLELGVKVGLSVLLMWWWGMVGLVVATVVALVFEKVFLMGYCAWRLGIPARSYTPLVQLVGWTVLLLGVIVVKYWM